MADQSTIDQAIETRWIANWTNGVKSYFMNAPTPSSFPEEYVNVLIMSDDANVVALGTGQKIREVGTVIIEVRYKKHTGTRRGTDLATEAGAIFDGELFDGIHFQAARQNKVYPKDRAGVNVVIPFWWDRVKL